MATGPALASFGDIASVALPALTPALPDDREAQGRKLRFAEILESLLDIHAQMSDVAKGKQLSVFDVQLAEASQANDAAQSKAEEAQKLADVLKEAADKAEAAAGAETDEAKKAVLTATAATKKSLADDYAERAAKAKEAAEASAAAFKETETVLLAERAKVAEHVVYPENAGSEADARKFLNGAIAWIDGILTDQLNEIFSYKKFQDLEASWRGLHYLVFNTETSQTLKIRILNATKDELAKDFAKAAEFDQSALFKKLYEEEYGTFGGSPYSVLIGDYYFENHEITLLENLSNVAASAHAPFISSPAPSFFGFKEFSELALPRDLAKIFDSPDYIAWKEFRKSEDSRYVALTLPRFLLRPPYGDPALLAESLDFDETRGDGIKASQFLWGNTCYALGQKIGEAYSHYGWTAAIRGMEGGGKVEKLPIHTFTTPSGAKSFICPTEFSITDRREKELTDLGFISLVHCKNTNYAVFFGGQTCNKPVVYNLAAANANAFLSAQLPYILNASRFAHYIKVMMRDKIGSFLTKDNVSTYLNTWISSYVLAQDEAGQSVKAQYPLREARVDVSDIPGKPGAYNATVFLRPHFQLEELTASIRLVAELPPPAA